MLKKWLNNDEYCLGILLGLIIPVPATLIFMILLRIVQNYMHAFVAVRDMDILLFFRKTRKEIIKTTVSIKRLLPVFSNLRFNK